MDEFEPTGNRGSFEREAWLSRTVIWQLLRTHDDRRHNAQKSKTMKETENKDEQFEKIAIVKSKYKATGEPIISIDTKKRSILAITTVRVIYIRRR